jgi:hypothetical protein
MSNGDLGVDVQKEPKHAEKTAEKSAELDEGASSRTKFASVGAIPPVTTGFVQAKAAASDMAYGVQDVAAAGVEGAGGALPHRAAIEASFGRHASALDGVQAHVGGKAGVAARAIGAQAYATGSSVAFGQSPDLHTAAHEAAHVVQQQAGVQLKGGVGKAGDSYEQNADAVADRVVQGKSAEDLLEPFAGASKAGGNKAVQCLGYELGKPLPAGAEKPLEEHDDQRRYSVEQYEHMWEAEQGKKMTPQMESTVARGCIGLTANNIAGGGNPLQYADAVFGDFDKAHGYMQMKNTELHQMRANPQTAAMAPQGEYVLFAKQFWSNQKDGDNSKPDDTAFRPDPKTGRVDMTGYKYKAQPHMVNFDYGFWDDASQSFWHANHMQPGMIVYQSTKEHFIRGYIDFDRCVFGVALAHNYDPGRAAMAANATNTTSH